MRSDAATDGGDARPLGRLAARAAALARGVVDLALPADCLACQTPVASPGGLCPACWSRFHLIERPYCPRLGTPFSSDPGPGALSPEAIADPPPFDRCRAVAVYDDVARRLVHGLKYGDRLELADWMGRWMSRAGGDLVAEADAVVPVPLHRGRLWSRRYNQAALLAGSVAARGSRRFLAAGLERWRATPQQVGLDSAERARNVRGAFRVAPSAAAAIARRRVLLVDDVYTTGATIKAASRALLRGGAAAVDVVVFARVVRPSG